MGIWGDDKKEAQVSEAVAAGIREAMEPVMTSFTQMATGAIEKVLEAEKESTRQMTDEFLKGLVEAANASYAGVQNGLTQTVESLKSVISESVAALDKELELLKAEAESQRRTLEETRKLQGELIAQLGNETAALKEIAESQAKTIASADELEAGLLAASKDIKNAAETTFAGIRDAQIKISNVYDGIADGATALVSREEKIIKGQKQLLDEAAEHLSSLYTSFNDNFLKAEQTLTKDYTELMTRLDGTSESVNRYSSALSAAAENLKASQAAYQEDLTNGIKETFAVMDEEAAKLASTLARTGEEIADAAANLPKALRGLN